MADIAKILAQVVLDAKTAISTFTQFGNAGVTQFKRLQTAAAQASQQINSSLSSANAGMQKIGSGITAVGKGFKSVGTNISIGVGAPLALIGRQAIKAAEGAEESGSRMEATFANVGKTLGVSLEDMQNWATETQKALAVTDEEAQDVQSTLMKNTNLTGKEFLRARDAVLDMAQQMGSDPVSAAQSLGKALNDPTRGLRALQEAGIAFTKAQREQITMWSETGQKAKATDGILKALETTYGGVADQFARTDTGQAAIAANQLDDAMEALGKKLIPIQTQFTKIITAILDAFLSLPEGVQNFLVTVAVIAVALGPVIFAIGMLVMGIGGLVTAAAYVAPAFAIIGGVMAGMVAAIATVVEIIGFVAVAIASVVTWPVIVAAALGALIVLIIANWDTIKEVIIKAITAIGDFFVNMWDNLATVFSELVNDWRVVWDEFVTMLGEGWNGFIGIIETTIDTVLGWLGDLVKAARDAWEWVLRAAGASSDKPAAGAGGEKKARGGMIFGRGGTDNVAAWLTRGEFVHRVSAVRKYGTGFMRAVNSGTFPVALARGYAVGGMVAAPSMRMASAGIGAGARDAGHSFTLVIDGQKFEGLRAPSDTAADMMAFAQSRKVRSAGRKPAWYS